jgi:hypothetical protein
MGMGLLPRRPLLTSFWTSGGLEPRRRDQPRTSTSRSRWRAWMTDWIAHTYASATATRTGWNWNRNLHCCSGSPLSPIDADVYIFQLVGYCCGVLQLGTEQNICVDTC